MQFKASCYRTTQANRKEKSPFCILILSEVAFAHGVGGDHSSSEPLPDSPLPNVARRMGPALALPPEKSSLRRKSWPQFVSNLYFHLSFLLFQITTNNLLSYSTLFCVFICTGFSSPGCQKPGYVSNSSSSLAPLYAPTLTMPVGWNITSSANNGFLMALAFFPVWLMLVHSANAVQC